MHVGQQRERQECGRKEEEDTSSPRLETAVDDQCTGRFRSRQNQEIIMIAAVCSGNSTAGLQETRVAVSAHFPLG